MAKPTNYPLHAIPAVWTLVHIVSAVGFGVGVFGDGWGWACLVGMATQVPWSVLLQVLACMSVVLHYFPLSIYQLCNMQDMACQSCQITLLSQISCYLSKILPFISHYPNSHSYYNQL